MKLISWLKLEIEKINLVPSPRVFRTPSGAVQPCCSSAWTTLTDNSCQSSWQAIGQLGHGRHGYRHTLTLSLLTSNSVRLLTAWKEGWDGRRRQRQRERKTIKPASEIWFLHSNSSMEAAMRSASCCLLDVCQVKAATGLCGCRQGTTLQC